MILRRKPASALRDFHDDDVYETHRDARVVHGLARYAFQLGKENGQKFSDIAVELDWDDVVLTVAQLAQSGEPRAVAILPLLRDPERVCAALDLLTKATAAGDADGPP